MSVSYMHSNISVFSLVKVVMAYPEAVWSCGSSGHASVSMVLHSMLASGQTLPQKLVQLMESMDKVEQTPVAPSEQSRDGLKPKEAAKNDQILKKLTEKETESPMEETVSKEVELVEVDLGGIDEVQVVGKGTAEDALAWLDQEPVQPRHSPILPIDLSGEERVIVTKPTQRNLLFPNGSLPRDVPCGPATVSGVGLHGGGGVLSPVQASNSPQEKFQQSPSLQPLLSASPQHPPITVRIERAEGDGWGMDKTDDVVAVSLRKDKKRKGKRSKNRNGGAPGMTGEF